MEVVRETQSKGVGNGFQPLHRDRISAGTYWKLSELCDATTVHIMKIGTDSKTSEAKNIMGHLLVWLQSAQ
jgi:hypothetical protein